MILSNLNLFPEKEHWVVLTTSSHHIPGDERSRTNPGHGYPAHTVNEFHYDFFFVEKEWLDRIRVLENLCNNYVAFKSSGKAQERRRLKKLLKLKLKFKKENNNV